MTKRHRRGRLRRSVKREANGRASRAGQPRLDAVVLAQPHRRGSRDQRCASIFGRFCIRLQLRRELYEAGEKYAAAIHRWRQAHGIREPFGNRSPAPYQDRPPLLTSLAARRVLRMEKAMVVRAGFKAFLAVRQLVCDGLPLGMDQEGAAIGGLMALCIDLRWLRPDDDPHLRRPVRAAPVRSVPKRLPTEAGPSSV